MLINVKELNSFIKAIQANKKFDCCSTSLFISFDKLYNTCEFIFIDYDNIDFTYNYKSYEAIYSKKFKVNINDNDFNTKIKENNNFLIKIIQVENLHFLSFLKKCEKLDNINLVLEMRDKEVKLKIDIDNVNYSFVCVKEKDNNVLNEISKFSNLNLDNCQCISLKKEDIQQIFNTHKDTFFKKNHHLNRLLCFHKIDNNIIEIANTTGMPLIYQKINAENNISNNDNFIIHFKSIKMLKNINEDIKIYIKDNCFYIYNDNFLIKQNLYDISSRYQNIIFDRNKAKKISFNVKDLVNCISTIDKDSIVSCLIKGNTMYFYSKTDNAIIKNKINIENNEKNQLYFEFNNEVLLSSLKFSDKNIKTLNLYFIDNENPMIIEQDVNTFCEFMINIQYFYCKSDFINIKNRRKDMGAFISEEVKKQQQEIKQQEEKEIKQQQEIQEIKQQEIQGQKIEIQGWADMNIGYKIVKGKQVLNRIRCPFKYLLLKDNKLFTKNGRYIADYDFLQKDYQNVKVSNKNKKYTGQKYILSNQTTIIILNKNNIISFSIKNKIKDIMKRVACF